MMETYELTTWKGHGKKMQVKTQIFENVKDLYKKVVKIYGGEYEKI